MNSGEPIVVSLTVSDELQVEGTKFACDLFREGLRERHGLRPLLSEARRHLEQSPLRRRYSRELGRVARWGLQLAAVQRWAGFDELVNRVKTEETGWEAHLHEAYVGFLFALAGCHGGFLAQEGQPIPDLRVATAAQSAVVECKRSDMLTAGERRNRQIWYETSGEILRFVSSELPAAMIRFYPQRDAQQEDHALLLGHTSDLVNEFKRRYAPQDWWQRTQSKDGAFRCVFVASHDPDQVFDAARGHNQGIGVPSDIDPFSLRFQVTLTEPLRCDSIWWVKIHERRSWARVERAVLRRIDEKASQLNRFRQSGHADGELPGIIWLDHPALVEGDAGELHALKERVVGKLCANQYGHFDAVAGVVLTNSRLLVEKTGQLHEQHRFSFAARPNGSLMAEEPFPFLSRGWWERVQSNLVPRTSILGLNLAFGSTVATPDSA